MSKLFSSLTIKDVTFKNRIVQSPMCMYSAEKGIASDWHFVHYGARAIGGSGTIMTEAVAISPEGRISPGDLGIWSDSHVEGLKRITTFLKKNGSVAGIQLAHSGRKGSFEVHGGDSTLMRTKAEGGWEVMGPSAISFSDDALTPKAMTIDDIESVKKLFAAATKRAVDAGFQLLEIHSAHGYLLHSFLSPISNKREDNYGGTIKKRARLLFEVVETIQSIWPKNLPIAVRISATDWDEAGWDSKSSQWLAQQLEKAGVDIIDVSSGGTLPNVSIPVGPAYQLPLAKDIKAVIKTMKVGTVGMITSAAQAETILLNDDADLIYIGRELLRNPYFPLQAAQELQAEVDVPKQYERAFPKNK